MMRSRQPHIDPFDIDESASEPPPRRQTSAQQNGTAYIWHSTTQELIPILPPDHPNYRENTALLRAAFRRWSGEAK